LVDFAAGAGLVTERFRSIAHARETNAEAMKMPAKIERETPCRMGDMKR
jgi:hypothetical protein